MGIKMDKLSTGRILLLILLFLSIGLGSHIATADTDHESTTINLGSYTTYAGSSVTVPIEITNATEIAGGSVNISFNPSIVNVQEVLAGDFGIPIANINNTNGFVRVAASRPTAVGKENASLAGIRFKGISKGITTLNITGTNLNYQNGTVFIPETSDGTITVSTPPFMYITSYDVCVDSNVRVPVEIKNATDIAGGSAKIVFNGSIVHVEEVTAADFGTNVTANIDNTNGSVHIAVANATAVGIEEAVLANITFKGLSEELTALEIQTVSLNDERGNVIIPETSDGTINVTGVLPTPSPCFIATAAYGTPMHEDIDTLRKFRNEVLSTNTPGKALVETYYSTSPPVANALAANGCLMASVRVLLLTPLVYFAGIMLNGGLFALIIAFLAGLLYLYRTRKYGIFGGILKSAVPGILSIVVLSSLVFTLGWLGYTWSSCATIAAYILPLIIPISIAVVLIAVIRPKYKNKFRLSSGGE